MEEGDVIRFEYVPFASLLRSHWGSIVEVRGFEPLTSAVRRQRSTGLSYTPNSPQRNRAIRAGRRF